MNKTITCPSLCGAVIKKDGNIVEWGLIEYIQDILFQDALGSAELCEFVVRVSKLLPKRGSEQVGVKIVLEKEDWSTLCMLASKQRTPGSPELIVAIATCNLSIFRASDTE